MLPSIIVYIALCLVGIGVPTSFAVCLMVANKQGNLSAKALRLCCLVLGLFVAILIISAYLTIQAPFEEPQSVIVSWGIILALLILTGAAAARLACLPLPKVLRRYTLSFAVCLVTLIPLLLTIAFFAYVMEHPEPGGDGTEISQDKGIGE